MAIDYSDFVVLILDSGERVFHRKHIRNWKGLETAPPYSFHNHHYNLMLDRAYRIRWAPWIWENLSLRRSWTIFREITRKKKVGLLVFQEPEEVTTDLIEPLHISRISQPSGLVDDPRPEPDRKNLSDKVTPFILKMIVDASSKYRKAYKSYAFGLKQKIMSKWMWLLMLGITGIVLLLYFTGYIVV